MNTGTDTILNYISGISGQPGPIYCRGLITPIESIAKPGTPK